MVTIEAIDWAAEQRRFMLDFPTDGVRRVRSVSSNPGVH
jgi:hypothetical protein